jgi:hypothetical protein
MKIRKHLSYANVVATAALFVALGGSAYAVSQITSGEIKNETIKSADLRDRKAVKGPDVKRNTLGGKEIAEQSLDGSRFAPVAGQEAGVCNPQSVTFVECAVATIKLRRPSRLLAIGTGGEESEAGPASAVCEVRIDGTPTPLSANPGEQATDNSSPSATDGFARTVVTADPLAAGAHHVAMACSEAAGDVRIQDPTIAAIAITAK